jgi:DHA1 family multidrug resistance protein-like MFS transporter
LQIGAILGVAGLAAAVAHIPAGALADAIGRKKLMAASWLIGLLAAWIMFLAGSLPLFAVGLVIYSLTYFVMSPLSSYITEARGAWPVARALTTTGAFFNLGVAVGPILGGVIAERIGLREVYGVAAGLFVPSTALILLIQSQPTVPHDGGSRYRNLLAHREFLGFLALAFLVMFGLYLSWPLTPNFLHSVRAVSLGQIGILGTFNALGGVALNLALGRLSPRRGYLIGQFVTGASVMLLWRTTGMPWFALGYFLAGSLRPTRSMVTAQVETLVSRAEIGTAYGIAESAQSVALFLAPILAGALFEVDPALPFPVSLAVIVVMLGLTFRLAPREKPAASSPLRSLETHTLRRDLP